MSEIIIELKQQLTDSQKQATLLRGMIAIAALHVRPTCMKLYDDLTEALAATADLDGLILCEKKPFEFRWKLRSNGFVQHTEKLLHTSSKHLWDITPLYRAWDPK